MNKKFNEFSEQNVLLLLQPQENLFCTLQFPILGYNISLLRKTSQQKRSPLMIPRLGPTFLPKAFWEIGLPSLSASSQRLKSYCLPNNLALNFLFPISIFIFEEHYLS